MSTIQNNNTDLQAILDAVNALPDKPVYETWVFELEDGTTVEKQVEVSA